MNTACRQRRRGVHPPHSVSMLLCYQLKVSHTKRGGGCFMRRMYKTMTCTYILFYLALYEVASLSFSRLLFGAGRMLSVRRMYCVRDVCRLYGARDRRVGRNRSPRKGRHWDVTIPHRFVTRDTDIVCITKYIQIRLQYEPPRRVRTRITKP